MRDIGIPCFAGQVHHAVTCRCDDGNCMDAMLARYEDSFHPSMPHI